MKDITLAIAVLTRKGIPEMIEDGGCGHWRASDQTLRQYKYVVATLNAKGDEDKASHGKGFMVGKIKGIERQMQFDPPRYLLKLSHYAEIDIPNMWPGNHNPVSYTTLEDLGIDPNGLIWNEFPSAQTDPMACVRPLSVHEAKLAIAKHMNLSPDAIKLSIEIVC